MRILWVSSLLLIAGVECAHALVFGPKHWKIDSSQVGVDKVKPRRPQVQVVRVARGHNPWVESQHMWSEAREMGGLSVGVVGEDDRTPAERLGYRLRLAGGELPRGLQLPEFPLLPSSARRDSTGALAPCLVLNLSWPDWDDGLGRRHLAPFRFGLLITCLDAAGNESEPSDTLWIADPAR